MKKYGKYLAFVLIVALLFMTGCGNENTPTKKVEALLGKYQSNDSEISTQLDKIISSDTNMSDEQKEEYRALMEKQYQNLSYKIKDEKIDGDTATVDVEIEVYDYATSISKSKEYYDEHKDEIEDTKETIDMDDNDVPATNDKDTKDGTTDMDDASDNDDSTDENPSKIDGSDGLVNETAAYIDYKIKQLKDVTAKVKYTLTFTLKKVDGEWQVQDLSDTDIKKIHGLYEE